MKDFLFNRIVIFVYYYFYYYYYYYYYYYVLYSQIVNVGPTCGTNVGPEHGTIYQRQYAQHRLCCHLNDS